MHVGAMDLLNGSDWLADEIDRQAPLQPEEDFFYSTIGANMVEAYQAATELADSNNAQQLLSLVACDYKKETVMHHMKCSKHQVDA